MPLRPAAWVWDDRPDTQVLFDVAVVMPTILRPSIARALESVYRQNYPGAVQILIGVDRGAQALEIADTLLRQRPPHMAGLLMALPYSTSVRHGGPHTAIDGGSLRAMLALAAHARHVAFLDDDNAWLPNHLSTLKHAIDGKAYAFTRRVLARESDFHPVVVDRWDSVGPAKERFASAGGFVDPNCLMIDKVTLASHLGRWAHSGVADPGITADRHFFTAIAEQPYGESQDVTVFYSVRPTNILLHFARENIAF